MKESHVLPHAETNGQTPPEYLVALQAFCEDDPERPQPGLLEIGALLSQLYEEHADLMHNPNPPHTPFRKHLAVHRDTEYLLHVHDGEVHVSAQADNEPFADSALTIPILDPNAAENDLHKSTFHGFKRKSNGDKTIHFYFAADHLPPPSERVEFVDTARALIRPFVAKACDSQ
jgi:hypothetical protein